MSASVCPETRERNFSLLIAWTWWGSEAKSCRNKPASTLCPLPSLIFFNNLLFLMSFCSNSLAILLKFDLKFQLHFLKEGNCVLKANWKTNPVGSLVEYICQWWDKITENKTNRNPKPTLGTVLEDEPGQVGVGGRESFQLPDVFCSTCSMISTLNACHGTWTYRSECSSFLPHTRPSSLIAVTRLTSEGIWDSARYDSRHWVYPLVDRTGKSCPHDAFVLGGETEIKQPPK